MILLIDYDNVDESERRLGIEHVVRKALALCDQDGMDLGRVRARIYGGWYDGGMLTRLAQRLGAEMRACSPVRYPKTGRSSPILIDIELAVSILAAPRDTVTNTFRKRGYPRNLQCEERPWLSCLDNANCPLLIVQEFITSGLCAAGGCPVQPRDVIYKQEQKVVDTMMVADLIYAAQQEDSYLAIVSRDDDIWPGLSVASLYSKALTHLSTDGSRRLPRYYNSLRQPPYRRVNWS